MVPGRILHRLAAWRCSPVTLQHIVEPLLADLQHQVAHSPHSWKRKWLLARGYIAFWQTMSLCGVRAAWTMPQRISAGQGFLWICSMTIAAVVLLGPHWVRTGDVSLSAARDTGRRLLTLAPMIAGTIGFNRLRRSSATTWRAARSTLAAIALAGVIASWANADLRQQIAQTTSGYVLIALLAWRIGIMRRARSPLPDPSRNR